MRQEKIICDHCGADIEPPHDHQNEILFFTLDQGVTRTGKPAIISPMMNLLNRSHDFCGSQCLKDWLRVR